MSVFNTDRMHLRDKVLARTPPQPNNRRRSTHCQLASSSLKASATRQTCLPACRVWRAMLLPACPTSRSLRTFRSGQ
jgi:hypothetical protein